MSTLITARSALRSSATLTAATKLSGLPNPARASSAFSLPNQTSQPICRSLVEMSRVLMDSIMPYHSATASALLQSMLYVNCSLCGWIPEDTQRWR